VLMAAGCGDRYYHGYYLGYHEHYHHYHHDRDDGYRYR
jgi:hypothetical protein